MWKMINNSFRNCLWEPTEVTYWLWKIQFIFINWSIYWCWFLIKINSSTCICVMSNPFWFKYWYKWYWRTICNILKYNNTYLNLFIIEIWMSYQPRDHKYSMIDIINTFLCKWKNLISYIIILYNTDVFIIYQIFLA